MPHIPVRSLFAVLSMTLLMFAFEGRENAAWAESQRQQCSNDCRVAFLACTRKVQRHAGRMNQVQYRECGYRRNVCQTYCPRR